MGAIEDIYADLDADVSLEAFREAVEQKVEEMGGLADEETAAMLVAHELGEAEITGVADVEPGMEEAKFVAKVVRVGDLRTFERDDEDAEAGRVLNADVADETGQLRVTFWDEQAEAAADELAVGDVLRIAGRPRDGYSGVEVSVDRAEVDEETDVDVQVQDSYRVAELTLGLSEVNLRGVLLATDAVRTFDRDDGSTGRVANLVLGDETGRVRVTLWDDQTDYAAELSVGESVEVVDGYVRDRDGDLELHLNDRSSVDPLDEAVEYVPDSTPIEALELDTTADVAGVVRSVDEKRTFDRDDGSQGQVRNLRLQDATGDVRVAMWGEKADLDVGPGDEVLFTDVEVQEGWREDLELSAGWRSSVVRLDDGATTAAGSDAGEAREDAVGLDAFAAGGTATERDAASEGGDASGNASETDAPTGPAEAGHAEGEHVEFTGVVVQAGDPVILDDGTETMSVETDADLTLGQEVTARGRFHDGRLDADDVV